jgi:autophagy-related protein 17
MASLLDSLVQHFDLCVNAIRNTEGGYAAVRKAASSQPPGAEPVSVSGVMSAEDRPEDGEPISEEERREMLEVLENDAAQVEDVVMELRHRLNDMELMHDTILEHVSSLIQSYNETTAAYNILEGVGSRLPNYIVASQDFKLHWEETKLQIQDQLTELESMRLFYESYHSSYDGLIVEIYRRRQSEEKVKVIIRKAMEQIEKVYEADMREREAFKGDVGDFLPVDLYLGVGSGAPRWEFVRVGGKGGDGTDEVETPDLERAVVEVAMRRDRERQRMER